MIHRRERDRGHFKTNIELMIVVVVVAVGLAITIPWLLGRRADRGLRCLEQVLARTSGAPPGGATCPYSGKPYAAAACPEPAGHLDSNPRFVQTEQGWRLEQTLPPHGADPISIGDGLTEVTQAPGRTTIRLRPSGLRRNVLAPALLLFFGIPGLVCLVESFLRFRRQLWAEGAGKLACFVFCGTVSFFLVGDLSSSTEIVVEPGRVTRVAASFGRRGAETVYAGCLGVVPVPARDSKRRRLQLVHRTGPDDLRCSTLETIPADRLDIAAWLNQAILR